MSGVAPSRPSKHIQERTRQWFRKAEHELAFLEYAPFDLDDPPTDTAGKMAHMASEYSLKAFLMLNKRKISRTHDLVELLRDIPPNNPPPLDQFTALMQGYHSSLPLRSAGFSRTNPGRCMRGRVCDNIR